ncbi:MAG: NUDIX domain-containing protein [Patescibacteria group bacterium]
MKLKGGELFVYLQKRSLMVKSIPGYFGLVGGGVENNETEEQGLVREVKEEIGLDLDLAKVKRFNRYEFLKAIKYVYLFEHEEHWEDKIIFDEESDYGQWFSTQAALALEKFILEDKIVINDLERALLKKPIK